MGKSELEEFDDKPTDVSRETSPLINQTLPELTSLENVLSAQAIISSRISSGVMDPLEGRTIMQSLEILRDGFIHQAKLFKSESDAISQAKKDEIDNEFNQMLLKFCDEFQELKRSSSPKPGELKKN